VSGGNGGVKDETSAEPTGLAAVEPEPSSADTVEALRRERDDLRDQLLRRRADFENFRKRVERDRAQAGVDAVGNLLQALVPGLDNLDRALETERAPGPLRDGVELIRREIQAALEAQGVVALDPKGSTFDPEIHQALSHEAMAGFPDGTIVEVFRKGYSFKGRLLRPALVKVAKGEHGERNSSTERPESATE
jgi:molecular chaperone GrpE